MHGATAVVRRRGRDGWEFLVLHRSVHAVDQGEWVWTPPSGMREPGESSAENATRELREETGLELGLRLVEEGDWAVFVADAPEDAEIVLNAEHDRYEWLPLDEACALCLPSLVAEQIRQAAR